MRGNTIEIAWVSETMSVIITILLCALAGRLKGGGPKIFREWVRRKFPKLDKWVDGDITGPLVFGLICLFWMPWYFALGGAIGWWVGMAPDVGQVMDELRKGNWKPGLQRGVYLGAAIALFTWNPAFIIPGILWPLAYWIGEKMDDKDWWFSEWLIGGLIGLAFISYL